MGERDVGDSARARSRARLDRLYDGATGPLANRFRELAQLGNRELTTLTMLADDLGLPAESRAFEAPDQSVDRVLWRPVARSSVLAILRPLVGGNMPVSLYGPRELAMRAINQMDMPSFASKTGLSERDSGDAIPLVANALIESELLDEPAALIIAGQPIHVWNNRRSLAVHRDLELGTSGTLDVAMLRAEHADGTPGSIRLDDSGGDTRVVVDGACLQIEKTRPEGLFEQAGNASFDVVWGQTGERAGFATGGTTSFEPKPWGGTLGLAAGEATFTVANRATRFEEAPDGVLLKFNAGDA